MAGQTAPGEGVVVYGDGVSFSGADNIIVRHMKFRMGKGGSSGKDAAGVANGTNMIFDHCSFAWGLDETFSINWDNKGTRAFKGDALFSDYTPVLTVKTQPKQVEMTDVDNYEPDLSWLQTDGQWDFSTPPNCPTAP